MVFAKVLLVALILFQVSWILKAAFICKNGKLIERSRLCDGTKDCDDNTDETVELCFNTVCPKEKFRCQYGGCIAKEDRCNGISDCLDGSDEKYCEGNKKCRKDEFQCFKDNECISGNLVCNGKSDCQDSSDEISEMCKKSKCPKGTFQCKYGGCINNDLLCDGFRDCLDGSDERKPVCDYVNCAGKRCLKEFVQCKPVKLSKGLRVTCVSVELGEIPCNESQPIGTVARFECDEFYVTLSEDADTEIDCQPDGNWNGKIPKCKPECGKAGPSAEVLIYDGRQITNWPWHATMYLLEDDKWIAACGGTLISESIVLTAAHCVWRKNLSHLKFAFNKYTSDINESDEYTQIKDVSKIIIPPNYMDFRSNYGSDIAAVLLTEPVTLSDSVKPACLDWNLRNMKQHLLGEQFGRVAGMGIMENGNPSKVLRALDILAIPTELCIKNQKRDFKKYVTYTTFCAGWTNGTSVCNGDSGGGLLFQDIEDQNTWILQGLVSISSRRKGAHLCDPSHFALFTKVGLYLDWLKEVVEEDLL